MDKVLNIDELTDNGVIMVSDSNLSEKNFDVLMEKVKSGSKVIFYKSALCDSLAELLDIETGFTEDDSWIVCRNTDLKYFDGSSSTDLKYNYSTLLGRPERHYFKKFSKSVYYTPILTYNNHTIVGSRKYGKGQVIICGLKLSGKLNSTPLLSKLFYFLLDL